jgi:hypothetical protein
VNRITKKLIKHFSEKQKTLFLVDSIGGLTPFIRFIGIANFIYCALAIGLLIKYYPLLTILGTTSFMIEVVIICGLSFVELNAETRNKEN